MPDGKTHLQVVNQPATVGNRPKESKVSTSEPAREQERLRAMSTTDLLRQAILEIKLLAKAEILHARQELKEELRQAKVAFILLGICIGLALCGLSVAFVGVALALPIVETGAAFIVAGAVLVIAAACGALGYNRLPKKPMWNTQHRLKEDLSITRGQFA